MKPVAAKAAKPRKARSGMGRAPFVSRFLRCGMRLSGEASNYLPLPHYTAYCE